MRVINSSSRIPSKMARLGPFTRFDSPEPLGQKPDSRKSSHMNAQFRPMVFSFGGKRAHIGSDVVKNHEDSVNGKAQCGDSQQ